MCKHNFCCAMSFCSSWHNRGAHSACPWCESPSSMQDKLCHQSKAGVSPHVGVHETCEQLRQRDCDSVFGRAGIQKCLSLWCPCLRAVHTGGCDEVAGSTARRTRACASDFLVAGSHAQTSCASAASNRIGGRQAPLSILPSWFSGLAFANYVGFAATSIRGRLPSKLATLYLRPKVPILGVLHNDVEWPRSVDEPDG